MEKGHGYIMETDVTLSRMVEILKKIENETNRRWYFDIYPDGSCGLNRLKNSSYSEYDMYYDFDDTNEFFEKIDEIVEHQHHRKIEENK